MAFKAVLTGDLVRSRKSRDPSAYIAQFRSLLSGHFPVALSWVEYFRGDGFQMVPAEPEQAFRCAVMVRAGILSASPPGERWDARLSIALGDDDHEGLGEVFVLSGHTLDQMTKRSPGLVFRARDIQLMDKFQLLTEFASAVIDGWTVNEAKTYWVHDQLKEEGQQAVAAEMGKQRTTVSRALQRAQADLVDRYVDYTIGSIRSFPRD